MIRQPERPDKPGELLRSEPLKDVTLPPGMRGWRILYTTTIDDQTPATAVATVFAPANMPPGPRPVIMWEHGTTGLLQKCMPSLASVPTMGIPALDHVARAGMGDRRDGLCVRGEGRSASLHHRRGRGAFGARLCPCARGRCRS